MFKRRRRKKRRSKSKQLEELVIFLSLIISFVLMLLAKVIVFLYDIITFYTSEYKQKSGIGFFKTYFNKGNFGEFKLYRKIIKHFGKENVFTNLYLENQNTDNTEIDLIALSPHGIYVFEMKNYSGYIYGSERNQYWTHVLNRNSKYKFYNPLKQNYVHTRAIENYLDLKENETIPIIVFSNNAKLKKIIVPNNKLIVQMRDINKIIRKNVEEKPLIFFDDKIKEFGLKFIERSNVSQEVKNKHIEQVKELKARKM